MAISTTFTELPTPPQRSDPTDFDDRADAFVDALYDLSVEANAWTAEANTTAATVNSLASSAETAKISAWEAVDALQSQGAPAEWAVGTTYDEFDVALGSDGRVYRSLVGSNVGNDPTTDTDGNWLALNPDPLLAAYLLFGSQLYPGWSLQYQQPLGTYPPTDADQPAAAVWSRGVERYRARFTWGTTGGATNNVESALLEYSNDSGSNYSGITTNYQVTITYDASGVAIAAAWSAP
jgi:hypothetical protein